MSLTFQHLSARYAAPVAAALLRDKSFSCDLPARETLAQDIGEGRRPDIAAQLFKQFADATDPTAARVNGKKYLYLNFIAQSYLKKNVKAEDFYKIRSDLHDLSIWGARLERSDIRQYTDLDDLSAALRPLQQRRDKKKAQETERKMPAARRARLMRETSVVYDGPEGKIVIPHTAAASRYWGSNTRWCIAAEHGNMFDDYNKNDPVFICLPRVTPQMQKDSPFYSSFKFALVGGVLYDERDDSAKTAPAYLSSLLDKAKAAAAAPETRAWLAEKLQVWQQQRIPDRHHAYAAWPRERQEAYDHLRLIRHDSGMTGLIKTCTGCANREFALAAVHLHPRMFDMISDTLIGDREIVLAYVANGGDPGEVCDSLRHDRAVTLAYLESCGKEYRNSPTKPDFTHIDPALVADRGFMLEAAARCGDILGLATADMQDDPEIVAAAVLQNPRAFAHASPRLRGDRGFVLELLNKGCGAALYTADPRFRSDAALALLAVQSDAGVLAFLSDDLRDNRDIVLAAVRRDGGALRCASERLRADQEIAAIAIGQTPVITPDIDRKLKKDPSFLRRLLCDAGAADALLMGHYSLRGMQKRATRYFGRDGMIRIAFNASVAQGKPVGDYGRFMPQLWGDVASFTDPRAARERWAKTRHRSSISEWPACAWRGIARALRL